MTVLQDAHQIFHLAFSGRFEPLAGVFQSQALIFPGTQVVEGEQFHLLDPRQAGQKFRDLLDILLTVVDDQGSKAPAPKPGRTHRQVSAGFPKSGGCSPRWPHGGALHRSPCSQTGKDLCRGWLPSIHSKGTLPAVSTAVCSPARLLPRSSSSRNSFCKKGSPPENVTPPPESL